MKKIIIVSIMFCLMGYTYADITNQLGSEAFDYKYEGDSTALSGYTAANGATITTDGDIATFDSVPYKYYIGNDWVTATSTQMVGLMRLDLKLVQITQANTISI